MSFCLNPDCQKPQNPENTNFCLSCGAKLLLKERYHALKPIGQGGFGKTFLAIDEDKPSKPACVIKQFLPSSQGTNSLEKAKELFNQEAVRLEELGKHPQIPELYAHFEQDNYLYLVQEYIDGENLEEGLQEGTFNEIQIRDLLTNLLPVVQFFHDHQTIHRDIKPENIIQRNMDKMFVLVDFGAARYATGTALLKTGTIIGDPRYMAPEQLSGKANFTSDLYCLGVTCLHLLTSVDALQLFDNSEDEWIWRDYLTTAVSDELGGILDKMVIRASKKRFQSAKEIWEVLNPFQMFPLMSSTSSQNMVSSPISITPVVSSPRVNPTVNQSSKILSSCYSQGHYKHGYIDENGTFIIPPQYDQAEAFYNGLAKVKIGDKWGMIDETGKRVIPCEFSAIDYFSQGLFKVQKYFISTNHSKGTYIWGLINQQGQIIIPCEFSAIDYFSQGLFKVQKYFISTNHDKGTYIWGLINQQGQIIVPCEFDVIEEVYNGLARVKKNSRWGMINQQGQIIVPCEFDVIEIFHEGLAKVRKSYSNKYGFINKNGIVIPCEFYNADNFHNGRARVIKEGLFGNKEYYIDKNGNRIK